MSRHLAVKWGTFVPLVAVFVASSLNSTAFAILTGIACGFLFSHIGDFVADKFAPEAQEPCDICSSTAAGCPECQTGATR